jgi:hypothetical protein
LCLLSPSFDHVQMLSEAWASQEWAAATPWNTPSSLTLAPGTSAVFSLRVLAVLPSGGQTSAVRSIPAALAAAGIATARAIPGYVLTPEMRTAALILSPPTGSNVSSLTVEPAGALVVSPPASSPLDPGSLKYGVVVSPGSLGRARITVVYSDGSVQSVHYFCSPPFPDVLALLRGFLQRRAWYADTSDPFGRAFSYMDYDSSIDWVTVQVRLSHWMNCGNLKQL